MVLYCATPRGFASFILTHDTLYSSKGCVIIKFPASSKSFDVFEQCVNERPGIAVSISLDKELKSVVAVLCLMGVRPFHNAVSIGKKQCTGDKLF